MKMRENDYAVNMNDLVLSCPECFARISSRDVVFQRSTNSYHLFSAVEHIFLISFDKCRTNLPSNLADKATCIYGKYVDARAPRPFVRGEYEHALKVTFTHAFALQIAINSKFRNAAFLEDDLVFVNRNLSGSVENEFQVLLRSSQWSFIRFGFRPYFLQHAADIRCASNCRCTLNSQFGPHFCALQQSGCDIRSSDLYVIHSDYFTPFQRKLLDLTAPSAKRIIDLYLSALFARQWLFLPQISFQSTLDIPEDYQIGIGALYVKKCAGRRPLPSVINQQLLNSGTNTYESWR